MHIDNQGQVSLINVDRDRDPVIQWIGRICNLDYNLAIASYGELRFYAAGALHASSYITTYAMQSNTCFG